MAEMVDVRYMYRRVTCKRRVVTGEARPGIAAAAKLPVFGFFRANSTPSSGGDGRQDGVGGVTNCRPVRLLVDLGRGAGRLVIWWPNELFRTDAPQGARTKVFTYS
jgi:hypothetical protein